MGVSFVLDVVTAIFNPRRFQSRYRLYADFAKHMAESGVRLLTVELAFGDRPHAVTTSGNPMHLQLRTDCELWHKERLLNLGIQRLLQIAPGAKHIAWIDADVHFSNPNWATETEHALQHYSVVQPFGEAINLDPHGHQQWVCAGAFRKFQERGYHQIPPMDARYWTGGHPGLGCAFRRETLDALGGLIDFCVAGSGDSHMVNALTGNPLRGDHVNSTLKGFAPGFLRALGRWGDRAKASVRENVGFVPGAIMHQWHGKSADRGYMKRWDVMRFHQFDPHEDLTTDAYGLYRFAGNKPRMADDIRRSLSERNEDSVDV
jgi:hypothetical protein